MKLKYINDIPECYLYASPCNCTGKTKLFVSKCKCILIPKEPGTTNSLTWFQICFWLTTNYIVMVSAPRTRPQPKYKCLDPAEEIGHGDECVARKREEREEWKPHRSVDHVVVPVLAKPGHPQVVAGRGRRRRRYEEVRQYLQRKKHSSGFRIRRQCLWMHRML